MRYKVAKIIRARRVRGWTQGELARRVNKHYTTICRIEAGTYGTPTTIKAIADELGLDMEDLILEEERTK